MNHPEKAQLDKIIHSVKELHEKYKNDVYMVEKLESYAVNQLPTILQNIKNNQIERQTRMDEMTTEQDHFIQQFLHHNQYFFVVATNTFFVYDGLHYQIYSEEDILHQVLSSISKDRQLMSWKHKTKINIMKRIKENNLIATIPESDTIQYVLQGLTNMVFPNKESTKYFLCVIGDNILKKHNHLIHYININAKSFIKYLDNVSTLLLGNHVNQTIKHKYYDHDYNDFRIIHINHSVKQESIWLHFLKSCALDVLCVACHYSDRFGSSDQYIIDHCYKDHIRNDIMFVKNTNQSTLVDQFIIDYIDKTEVESGSIMKQISWKNMEYLWKLYLDENKCPSVIFMNHLKQLLIEKLNMYYQSENDVFINISSKYLPSIQRFLKFWDQTMVRDEEESDLEIEEIILMFKSWSMAENEIYTTLTEQQIVDIIHYYYQDTEILHDKYIIGLRCNIWDKQVDLNVAVETLREEMNYEEKKPISIYDAYSYYCKFKNNSTTNGFPKLIVNKSYFEKYIFDHYSEYIYDNNWLSEDWVINN